MAELSPQRRRMIEDMTVRKLSPAMQRSYISAVSKLSRYFEHFPGKLELEDQEERERLAGEKFQRRGKVESQLAQLQRSINRMWADYETERVPVEIVGPKLKEAQTQKVALQAELAEPPKVEKVLGLHPAALRHYEEHV